MLARSHLVVAFSCIAVYKAVTVGDLTHNPLDYIIGALAALLPDIDDNRSYIGSRLAFIAFPIRMTFGHRGITHSLLMLIILGVVVYFYANDFNWIIPFVIGYASHLAADYVTNTGIPLFYPYQERFRFFVTFNTGSITEYVVLFFITLGMSVFTVYFQGVSIMDDIRIQDPDVYKSVVNFLEKMKSSATL